MTTDLDNALFYKNSYKKISVLRFANCPNETKHEMRERYPLSPHTGVVDAFVRT